MGQKNTESNDLIKIISTMTQDEIELISELEPSKKNEIKVSDLAKKSKIEEIKLRRALLWLSNKVAVKIKNNFKNIIELDENGTLYQKKGLPERIILSYLSSKKSASIKNISENNKVTKEEIKASIGILKSKNSITLSKKGNEIILEITASGIKSASEKNDAEEFLKKEFPIEEEKLSEKEKEILSNLLKRKKIISKKNINDQSIIITALGKELASEIKKKGKDKFQFKDNLTPEMITTGSWKNTNLRPYDVSSEVPLISAGRRHPFSEVMNILKNIFIEMGFEEMSGPWVETQFWCMDSMWIPQNHPARFAQDTFYIPLKGRLPKKDLVDKVRNVHETGAGTGSKGHRQKWDEDLAKQLILRTHSTATSFRTLSKIDKNQDCKYFYIANNFRNETADATHLSEFVQAEGFIMADDLSLSDLMGFIRKFYSKLGITKIKFKPTYNPYTEPSMEAHYYDEKKKKWYALINSGIFRPEALYPYGIKKRVIAWGMGASRIASILLKKHNLREIVGPDCSFDWIRHHKEIIKLLEK